MIQLALTSSHWVRGLRWSSCIASCSVTFPSAIALGRRAQIYTLLYAEEGL